MFQVKGKPVLAEPFGQANHHHLTRFAVIDNTLQPLIRDGARAAVAATLTLERHAVPLEQRAHVVVEAADVQAVEVPEVLRAVVGGVALAVVLAEHLLEVLVARTRRPAGSRDDCRLDGVRERAVLAVAEHQEVMAGVARTHRDEPGLAPVLVLRVHVHREHLAAVVTHAKSIRGDREFLADALADHRARTAAGCERADSGDGSDEAEGEDGAVLQQVLLRHGDAPSGGG